MDDDDDGLDFSPLIRAGSGRQVEVQEVNDEAITLSLVIPLIPETDRRRFIGWELQVNYFQVAECPSQWWGRMAGCWSSAVISVCRAEPPGPLLPRY